jgi:hypothetical protein
MEEKPQVADLKFDRTEHGFINKQVFIFNKLGITPSSLRLRELELSRVERLLSKEGASLAMESRAFPLNTETHYEESIYLLPEAVILIEHETAHVDVTIFYRIEHKNLQTKLAEKLNKCRTRRGDRPTIGFINMSDNGELVFNDFKIEKKKLDVSLLYGASFLTKYDYILKRLKAKKEHGLVVFHGDSGTGKTMLIRNIISKVSNKQFLFIPVDMVDKLTGPQLLVLLNQRPNSVLVIEEAEGLLKPRMENQGRAAVANLLNITDGLLRDFLHFQVICTFNCDLKELDPALLRKGRLIAEHKFEPLPLEQAIRVAEHYHLPIPTEGPKSLAELFDAGPALENSFNTSKKVGFRVK